MSLTAARRTHLPDLLTLSLYFIIVGIGWGMITSASLTANDPVTLSLSAPYGRQLLFIIVSSVLMAACLLIPYTFWRNFSFVFYVLALLLLVAVLFFGSEIKGARSWFSLGAFGFQPSEYAKLGVALIVASFTSSPSFSTTRLRNVLSCIGLFALPAVLILLQPDAGSSLVFLSIFILLYRLGLWGGYYVVLITLALIVIATVAMGRISTISAVLAITSGLILLTRYPWKGFLVRILITSMLAGIWFVGTWHGAGDYLNYGFGGLLAILLLLRIAKNEIRSSTITVIAVLLAIGLSFSTEFLMNDVLEPHQRERINVWLKPSESDPRGALYNVIQSKVAIGSGGWFGKGYREGTMTNLNYVPEQQTDFIFCTLGEEFGFFGVVMFLVLYGGLIIRILILAEDARKAFVRNYGYIVVGYLFIHFLINIGMTMGLAPIIGIPLPFVSYGGSSLIFFSIMVGIFLRLKMDDR